MRKIYMKFSSIWKMISADCLNGLQRMEWLQTQQKSQLKFPGPNRQRGPRLAIEENKLPATDCVKLLLIKIDNKLMFKNHNNTLCSKVNKKISTFSRLNKCISKEQT